MTTEQAKKKIEELEPIQAKLWEDVKTEEEVYVKKQKAWNEVYTKIHELKNYVKFTEELS